MATTQAVKILDVTRRGEWYTVKGWYRNRHVSADIHAKDIDGKPEPLAYKNFRRAVEMVGNHEALEDLKNRA